MPHVRGVPHVLCGGASEGGKHGCAKRAWARATSVAWYVCAFRMLQAGSSRLHVLLAWCGVLRTLRCTRCYCAVVRAVVRGRYRSASTWCIAWPIASAPTQQKTATCSMQHAAHNRDRATYKRACGMQRAACVQHATCCTPHATCDMLHAARCTQHATGNAPRAACSGKAAARNAQHTACALRRAQKKVRTRPAARCNARRAAHRPTTAGAATEGVLCPACDSAPGTQPKPPSKLRQRATKSAAQCGAVVRPVYEADVSHGRFTEPPLQPRRRATACNAATCCVQRMMHGATHIKHHAAQNMQYGT